jgi:hypothetical protein
MPDCNSIKLTLKKNYINPRIARWVLFLLNYEYEIDHRTGIRMQHIDALSTNYILVVEGCTFSQSFLIKQTTDLKIKEIEKF